MSLILWWLLHVLPSLKKKVCVSFIQLDIHFVKFTSVFVGRNNDGSSPEHYNFQQLTIFRVCWWGYVAVKIVDVIMIQVDGSLAPIPPPTIFYIYCYFEKSRQSAQMVVQLFFSQKKVT